jgi:predicted transcriptional regulator
MQNQDAPEPMTSQLLLYLARNPKARMRDMAEFLAITERAVLKIVSDLEQAGLLTRSRNENDGRRYRYELHLNSPLRHPAETEFKLSSLLKTDD